MATISPSIISQSDPGPRTRTPIVSQTPTEKATPPEDTEGEEEQELPNLEESGVQEENKKEGVGADENGDGHGDGGGGEAEEGIELPILSPVTNGENEGKEKDIDGIVIPDSDAVSSLSSSPSRSLRKDEEVEMRDIGDIERESVRLEDGEAGEGVGIDVDGGDREVVEKLAIARDELEEIVVGKEEKVPVPSSKTRGATSSSTSENEDDEEAPNKVSTIIRNCSTMDLDEPISAPKTTGKDTSVSSSDVSKPQNMVIEQQDPLPSQDQVEATNVGTKASSNLRETLSTEESQSRDAQEDKTTSPPSQPEKNHLNPSKPESGGSSEAGFSQNKDVLFAELKAMKIASLQARNTSLLSEIASKREKLEVVTKELEHPAAETVKNHIKLLHDYNDIRDVGQGLVGMIADNRGVRIGEIYGEFGVDVKD